MKYQNNLDWAVIILLIIGGINWGLIGLFNLNPVNVIFGSIPIIERIIYILVGVCAVYKLYLVITTKSPK